MCFGRLPSFEPSPQSYDEAPSNPQKRAEVDQLISSLAEAQSSFFRGN